MRVEIWVFTSVCDVLAFKPVCRFAMFTVVAVAMNVRSEPNHG